MSSRDPRRLRGRAATRSAARAADCLLQRPLPWPRATGRARAALCSADRREHRRRAPGRLLGRGGAGQEARRSRVVLRRRGPDPQLRATMSGVALGGGPLPAAVTSLQADILVSGTCQLSRIQATVLGEGSARYDAAGRSQAAGHRHRGGARGVPGAGRLHGFAPRQARRAAREAGASCRRRSWPTPPLPPRAPPRADRAGCAGSLEWERTPRGRSARPTAWPRPGRCRPARRPAWSPVADEGGRRGPVTSPGPSTPSPSSA